jgi:hypothetical protein
VAYALTFVGAFREDFYGDFFAWKEFVSGCNGEVVDIEGFNLLGFGDLD